MIYKCKCFFSLFFDCIDIICAFSTLALVFKDTKKGKEKKRRSLLGYRLKQGEQVWKRSWYFNFSVIAPCFSFLVFDRCRGCAWVCECARACERACVCVRARERAYLCARVCVSACVWKLAILLLFWGFLSTHTETPWCGWIKRDHWLNTDLWLFVATYGPENDTWL